MLLSYQLSIKQYGKLSESFCNHPQAVMAALSGRRWQLAHNSTHLLCLSSRSVGATFLSHLLSIREGELLDQGSNSTLQLSWPLTQYVSSKSHGLFESWKFQIETMVPSINLSSSSSFHVSPQNHFWNCEMWELSKRIKERCKALLANIDWTRGRGHWCFQNSHSNFSLDFDIVNLIPKWESSFITSHSHTLDFVQRHWHRQFATEFSFFIHSFPHPALRKIQYYQHMWVGGWMGWESSEQPFRLLSVAFRTFPIPYSLSNHTYSPPKPTLSTSPDLYPP